MRYGSEDASHLLHEYLDESWTYYFDPSYWKPAILFLSKFAADNFYNPFQSLIWSSLMLESKATFNKKTLNHLLKCWSYMYKYSEWILKKHSYSIKVCHINIYIKRNNCKTFHKSESNRKYKMRKLWILL